MVVNVLDYFTRAIGGRPHRPPRARRGGAARASHRPPTRPHSEQRSFPLSYRTSEHYERRAALTPIPPGRQPPLPPRTWDSAFPLLPDRGRAGPTRPVGRLPRDVS